MPQKQVTLSIIPENTQVILIGASQFDDEKLFPLPSVNNNIEALKQLFVNPEIIGIPNDNVTVIVDKWSDAEILPLLEAPIKKALDTLIIYYAGHGVPHDQALYLATKGTVFTKPQRSGALLFDDIRDAAMDIGELTAGKIIFILDCCYSGLAREEKYRYVKSKKIFIMAAATTMAKAPQGETYTAFTNEFLHILKKGINNNKETLTLEDIYENIENQLVAKNFPKPQQVAFGKAYELKIAYNRAYQPSTQNEVQYVKTNLTTQENSSMKKTTILFLSADPSNAARLRLGREKRNIQEKLQLAKMREQFSLHEKTSVRPSDLTQAIHDSEPQILHFAGYGESTGELCFENEEGEVHKVQPEALASLFELIANQVHCVILNACYSNIQANVIAKHIDYVIGMSGEISDGAALAFAVGFYKALGGGKSFEEAHRFGIVELKLLNIPEHLTPVLLKKSELKEE